MERRMVLSTSSPSSREAGRIRSAPWAEIVEVEPSSNDQIKRLHEESLRRIPEPPETAESGEKTIGTRGRGEITDEGVAIGKGEREWENIPKVNGFFASKE
jgi:hypothetical protein